MEELLCLYTICIIFSSSSSSLIPLWFGHGYLLVTQDLFCSYVYWTSYPLLVSPLDLIFICLVSMQVQFAPFYLLLLLFPTTIADRQELLYMLTYAVPVVGTTGLYTLPGLCCSYIIGLDIHTEPFPFFYTSLPPYLDGEEFYLPFPSPVPTALR